MQIAYRKCYIWKQSLKGVPSNMCPLKLGKPDTLNIYTKHYNDRDDQHHHLSDVKLLLITCIKKILSR